MSAYEPISVFDMFKIGVGPSSSHTLGPWRAAQKCTQLLANEDLLSSVVSIQVLLYGSLAKTGKGHGTDIAVLLGLSGEDPETFKVDVLNEYINTIYTHQQLTVMSSKTISFSPEKDIVFLMNESLPYHPNALTFLIQFQNNTPRSFTYYSVGGGFVEQEGQTQKVHKQVMLPFPVTTASDLLHWCRKTGMAIHEIVAENEQSWRSEDELYTQLNRIYNVMEECIYLGCHTEGILPGGLRVKRRAAALNKKLLNGTTYNSVEEWVSAIQQGGATFKYILDWVSCFALAVNEQNASFGRVVTAPTNGAAGVIPAVLFYHIVFEKGNPESIRQFLCTAAEVGSIFKKGATISAAMGGCQAEIGVSSAMAAAALTEVNGGSQQQALMAAEIAMEHHLGLTCDPIAGLVQVPCIERNTMGAVKAITASQLALQSTPDFAKISLDTVINTMWQTAIDMNHKYKETSEGGLALHLPLGLIEC